MDAQLGRVRQCVGLASWKGGAAESSLQSIAHTLGMICKGPQLHNSPHFSLLMSSCFQGREDRLAGSHDPAHPLLHTQSCNPVHIHGRQWPLWLHAGVDSGTHMLTATAPGSSSQQPYASKPSILRSSALIWPPCNAVTSAASKWQPRVFCRPHRSGCDHFRTKRTRDRKQRT